jgi:hypothetical protein
MRKNSPILLCLLVLLAACRGGDTYRKIRVELPAYSTLHPEQFEQAIFSGFLVAKEPDGLDLNKEIAEYFGPDFEKKLHFRVTVQRVALESEELFRKPDFWRSLAPGPSRVLYVTGKAELTREMRKSILGKAKSDADDPLAQQRGGVAERTLFSLSLHLYLIRGDSGEVVLDRDFKETKAYTNPKQRADFAFYDLAQRVRTKLFRPILSEERMQERYLLLK